MPSNAWNTWNTARASELDEIESAHRSVGGTGRGRRYATEQINHAYAVLLAAQFQGFCRDLHSECADLIVRATTSPVLRPVIGGALLLNRSLERGNANPGSIGADFNRFGLTFWTVVDADHALNQNRRRALEELNTWRNAIAHQDFNPVQLGGVTLRLRRVQGWRSACEGLARSFDNVMFARLQTLTGQAPW
jgi:hypothetical protein